MPAHSRSPSSNPQRRSAKDIKPSDGLPTTKPTTKSKHKPAASATSASEDSECIAVDEDEDVKPANKRAKNSHATSSHPAVGSMRSAWTGDEYLALFEHIVKHGTRRGGMAGAVPGRTPNQSYMAWRWVI